MRVEETKLDGVLLITPEVFRDHRGIYVETYNIDEYSHAGIPQIFVQDDFSISHQSVLRGIHGDDTTWKLIDCPVGEIQLAVVNWNLVSEQYKQWQLFRIGYANFQQVLIPPKFGNGHLVLTPYAVFHYKQSDYYQPEKQFTIPYNSLGIPWLAHPPITSERDKGV